MISYCPGFIVYESFVRGYSPGIFSTEDYYPGYFCQGIIVSDYYQGIFDIQGTLKIVVRCFCLEGIVWSGITDQGLIGGLFSGVNVQRVFVVEPHLCPSPLQLRQHLALLIPLAASATVPLGLARALVSRRLRGCDRITATSRLATGHGRS